MESAHWNYNFSWA